MRLGRFVRGGYAAAGSDSALVRGGRRLRALQPRHQHPLRVGGRRGSRRAPRPQAALLSRSKGEGRSGGWHCRGNARGGGVQHRARAPPRARARLWAPLLYATRGEAQPGQARQLSRDWRLCPRRVPAHGASRQQRVPRAGHHAARGASRLWARAGVGARTLPPRLCRRPRLSDDDGRRGRRGRAGDVLHHRPAPTRTSRTRPCR
mmetsp:Transcript_23044/g.75126  ORF Transcript_23044/g.75126 Transcript_23044/m.75126 type:complete len:205 (+) Transcript_23044:30-644(+)